jgi:hypothetical protein
MTTEFQTASAPRPQATDFGHAPAHPHAGTPSPSTPTNSTPWGSTSTASGSTAPAPAASPSTASGSAVPASEADPVAKPTWTSTPLGHADAPTASVPLVQASIPSVDATAASAAAANRAARTARARGPRRARLQLRHVNPWTVLKFSCVLSIALFFVWLIVIGVLFGVLDGAGVIGKINNAYTTIQGGDSKPPVTAGVVFGGAAIIGVVNIVLFIALTTVGSVVYNLCADLVGGIEITLSER